MAGEVTITLLANAGVLVEYRGLRFMVDAIHQTPGHVFSTLSAAQWEAMYVGGGVLRHVPYLLFTHHHPDHITPHMVEEYLEYNKVEGVFLPMDGSTSMEKVKTQAGRLGVSTYAVPYAGEKRYQLTPGAAVTAFATRHMGEQYQHVRHHCYLLELGTVQLLFTADAEYIPENFSVVAEKNIDVVFVNPLFYHNQPGRDLLVELIKPRQTVIYHIPFASDDKGNFRKMVERSIERYGEMPFGITAFSEPGQELVL